MINFDVFIRLFAEYEYFSLVFKYEWEYSDFYQELLKDKYEYTQIQYLNVFKYKYTLNTCIPFLLIIPVDEFNIYYVLAK